MSAMKPEQLLEVLLWERYALKSDPEHNKFIVEEITKLIDSKPSIAEKLKGKGYKPHGQTICIEPLKQEK